MVCQTNFHNSCAIGIPLVDSTEYEPFGRTCSAGSLFTKEKRKIPKSWGELQYYGQGMYRQAVTFLTIILASGFLIGAVAWLSNVQRTKYKLAIIAGFTMAFAGILAFLTDAKRPEIFASTAVYVYFSCGDLVD
jgi:hypothetical protein